MEESGNFPWPENIHKQYHSRAQYRKDSGQKRQVEGIIEVWAQHGIREGHSQWRVVLNHNTVSECGQAHQGTSQEHEEGSLSNVEHKEKDGNQVGSKRCPVLKK